MTPRTVAKVGLTLTGFVAFAFGVRFDEARARWAGIACVALAFLLRFGSRRDSNPE